MGGILMKELPESYYKKFKKRLDVIKNNRKLYKDLTQINMSKRR